VVKVRKVVKDNQTFSSDDDSLIDAFSEMVLTYLHWLSKQDCKM